MPEEDSDVEGKYYTYVVYIFSEWETARIACSTIRKLSLVHIGEAECQHYEPNCEDSK